MFTGFHFAKCMFSTFFQSCMIAKLEENGKNGNDIGFSQNPSQKIKCPSLKRFPLIFYIHTLS